MVQGWLTGWKEIATYIGRCVKTAKKYHTEYGMPILKDPGGNPVAIPDELNIWINEFNRLSDNIIQKID